MTQCELTNCAWAARTAVMQGMTNRKRGLVVLMSSALALGGCISVNAPDKPIVIELNINIKQEIIYRLAADAGNTIETNPDIF